jgi:hypothetical protein
MTWMLSFAAVPLCQKELRRLKCLTAKLFGWRNLGSRPVHSLDRQKKEGRPVAGALKEAIRLLPQSEFEPQT